MTCYLIRHGKDDETVRGGWSQKPLTDEGIRQAQTLAHRLSLQSEFSDIRRIYSSDLPRARQTAEILAEKGNLPVELLPEFREVNNGELAGMDNQLALERYPGLFWNQLGWEQRYPGGESPREFYERVREAWENFSQKILIRKQTAALITHGGVIQVILSLIHSRQYSNSAKHKPIPYASAVELAYEDGKWNIIERKASP